VGRGQTRLAARSGFDNAPVRRWGKLHIYVHTAPLISLCTLMLNVPRLMVIEKLTTLMMPRMTNKSCM
jgi:hypothetical protein